MRLHRLELRNIRSYTHAVIDIPDGSLLLAGDIGAGKTTILLAIEYALFGILKGTTSGATLLRHGAREGSVILECTVNGEKLTVMRALKRTKTSIAQSPGYLELQGVRTDLMPTEMNARIIERLGYPEELARRNPSLVYRYTVFTPQEDMKLILSTGREERLDTIRKLFDIDKYKRIRDNTATYLRDLKHQKALESARFEGYTTTETDIKRLEQESRAQKGNLNTLEPQRAHCEKELGQLQTMIGQLEQADIARQKIEKELAAVQSALIYAERRKASITQDIERTKTTLAGLPEQITEPYDGNVLALEEEKLRRIHDKRLELAKKRAEFSVMQRAGEEIKKQIENLTTCPTCKQPVGEGHKKDICTTEDLKITNALEKLDQINTLLNELHTREDACKARILEQRQREKQHIVAASQTAHRKDLQNTLEHLQKELAQTAESIGYAGKQSAELQTMIREHASHITELSAARAAHAAKQKELRDIEVTLARVSAQLHAIDEQRTILESEREKKREAQKRAQELGHRQHWLETYFVPSMGIMERQVLAAVHREFQAYFADWFATLMDSGEVQGSLDAYFTPIIHQNGYETMVESLSGGERTAVALAYRLALNKVVNEFIQGMHANGILILDEPTDGFSTEQLDRMRDVLEKLNLPQVILVSHEQKLESFVQNVIRIDKRAHESRVFS